MECVTRKSSPKGRLLNREIIALLPMTSWWLGTKSVALVGVTVVFYGELSLTPSYATPTTIIVTTERNLWGSSKNHLLINHKDCQSRKEKKGRIFHEFHAFFQLPGEGLSIKKISDVLEEKPVSLKKEFFFRMKMQRFSTYSVR